MATQVYTICFRLLFWLSAMAAIPGDGRDTSPK